MQSGKHPVLDAALDTEIVERRGFAACTPGMDGFWGPLAGGASLARPVPLQRWDVDVIYSPEVR